MNLLQQIIFLEFSFESFVRLVSGTFGILTLKIDALESFVSSNDSLMLKQSTYGFFLDSYSAYCVRRTAMCFCITFKKIFGSSARNFELRGNSAVIEAISCC